MFRSGGRSSAGAQKGRSGGWREEIKTIIYAVLIALVVRTVAYEPFHIPSESMLPTLLVGDYLFVSKFAYGYSRYSMPFGPDLFDGRVLEKQAERGDVVVFKLPSDPSKDYIKRIIGVAGDRVQVRAGVLYINEEAVKRERVSDFLCVPYMDGNPYFDRVEIERELSRRNGDSNVTIQRLRYPHSVGGITCEPPEYLSDPPAGDFGVFRFARYRETLPNGVSYLTLDIGPDATGDDTAVFSVPENHYFVMGDNRDNSIDSRFRDGVGFLPAENLVGRASFFFFSKSVQTPIWEVWNWRFSRFFDGVGPSRTAAQP